MKQARKIAKESTRALILSKTKELIVSNGIVNTSTKQISDICKIAHGTIFFHFKNRDELISTVIKQELLRIAKVLSKLENINTPLDKLLDEYLSLIASEEDLLVTLNKEFPFLSDGLQREILTIESIVKKLFYNRIEQGISDNIFKSVTITTILSFLFGTIHYYLVRKELTVNSGSVINKKKREIITVFVTILNNQNMETKTCESCGMSMTKIEDFGGQNPQNTYCRYCTDMQGNLKTYEEKVTDFKNLLMKTQDLSDTQALKMAKESLKQFPAWKDIAI